MEEEQLDLELNDTSETLTEAPTGPLLGIGDKVAVFWSDAARDAVNGWKPLSGAKPRIVEIVSVGYILHMDGHTLNIAQSLSDQDMYDTFITILVNSVHRIEKLQGQTVYEVKAREPLEIVQSDSV